MAKTLIKQNQVNQSYPISSATLSVSGTLTVTKSIHSITPYSGSSDDLVTITGMGVGQSIKLFSTNPSTNTITIKHGTGNISCFGGKDMILTGGVVDAIYDGTTVFISGGNFLNPYTQYAVVTTNATIALTGTETFINWNTEEYDANGWHNTSTNTDKIYPTPSGIYVAKCGISTNSVSTLNTYMRVEIMRNASVVIGTSGLWSIGTVPFLMSVVSRPAVFNSGDYVSMRAWVTNTAGSPAIDTSSWFSIESRY